MTARATLLGSAVLALALAGAFAAEPARASCGAEGCPLESRGPESQSGRFGLDLGYQYVDQNKLWDGNGIAGPPPDDEHEIEVRTLTRSWIATGRAQFGRRLSVNSTLPYIDREHRHLVFHHTGYYIPAQWHFQGFGDLLTSAQYTVLGVNPEDKTSLALRLGVKLPTGRTHVEEVDGEEPEPPARPGSGSTDVLGGFQVRRMIHTRTLQGAMQPVPLSLGFTWRANGKGTDDYRMGNVMEATLAGGYALSGTVRALMQVNARHHLADEPGPAFEEVAHTAGTSLYLTPGVRAQVAPLVAAFAYYQFRAYEHTDGPQLVAPYHLMVGASYSFGP